MAGRSSPPCPKGPRFEAAHVVFEEEEEGLAPLVSCFLLTVTVSLAGAATLPVAKVSTVWLYRM